MTKKPGKETDMTTRAMTAFAVAATLLAATGSHGQNITPSDILKEVEAAYKSMQTYKAEGTITSDIDTGEVKMRMETSFSILLKRPNLYLVSWTQKNNAIPGIAQSGAVWSDGTQPYLFMGMMNAYSKMTTDQMALAGATGISAGAAFTIPSLFLSAFKEQPAPFLRMKDPKIEKVEKLGDEECYVLSGPSATSKKVTFWISKASFLIRKYERSLEPPEGAEGGTVIPEITDDQLEEVIKGMGQEVTAESKKNMREMIEKSRTRRKTTKRKGSIIEYYETISSPELDQTNFKFALPEGTVLKDSLFGGVFGGDRGISKAIDSDKK